MSEKIKNGMAISSNLAVLGIVVTLFVMVLNSGGDKEFQKETVKALSSINMNLALLNQEMKNHRRDERP